MSPAGRTYRRLSRYRCSPLAPDGFRPWDVLGQGVIGIELDLRRQLLEREVPLSGRNKRGEEQKGQAHTSAEYACPFCFLPPFVPPADADRPTRSRGSHPGRKPWWYGGSAATASVNVIEASQIICHVVRHYDIRSRDDGRNHDCQDDPGASFHAVVPATGRVRHEFLCKAGILCKADRGY